MPVVIARLKLTRNTVNTGGRAGIYGWVKNPMMNIAIDRNITRPNQHNDYHEK